jgi:Ca2+-binding RTX toxin-like protein
MFDSSVGGNDTLEGGAGKDGLFGDAGFVAGIRAGCLVALLGNANFRARPSSGGNQTSARADPYGLVLADKASSTVTSRRMPRAMSRSPRLA